MTQNSHTRNKQLKKRNVFIVSLLISLIIAPLRGGYISIGDVTGFRLSSIVGFMILFAFVFFVFYKNGKKDKQLSDLCILAFVALGTFLVELPIRIIDFEGTLVSLLESLIRLFGIVSGYLFYKLYSNCRVVATVAGVICLSAAMWLSTTGYIFWLHKLGRDTFTGQLAQAEFIPLRFQTASGDTVRVEDFRGKYLILDCWFTYCGICFQKFPQVQALYERYQDNENIVIYSLHARMEEKTRWGWGGESYHTGAAIIKREGYSFPTLSICMNDTVLREEAGVRVFPTVLIFDKESRLIFRGSVEFAERFLRRRVLAT